MGGLSSPYSNIQNGLPFPFIWFMIGNRQFFVPESGEKDVFGGFTYPFPLFPRDQPGLCAGASGSMGAAQGARRDRDRGTSPIRPGGMSCGRSWSPPRTALYTLKDPLRLPCETDGTAARPRFIVTGEISSIYKKNGRVRKVHNLLLLPGLEQAECLAKRLEEVGNLHSDGRPILGLDSRDLLEITLETCPGAVFIPAHIWTPHFPCSGPIRASTTSGNALRI